MKPATEILLSAAFVLTPEEQWTRNEYARSARGVGVARESTAAICWCADGALQEAQRTMGLPPRDYYAAMNMLGGVTPQRNAIIFNDSAATTHAEVLAALYEAAELSEAS